MELQRIAQAIDLHIRPVNSPVAVKMASSADEIPDKARIPKRDMGMMMPLCQGIALARRNGWLVAMDKEDQLCPVGAFTLGFVPTKAKFLDGTFNVPVWLKNQDVRAKWAQSVRQIEPGKYSHILIGPIHEVDFEPHMLIVSGNPAQISRLIQAHTHVMGEPVISRSHGGGSACVEEIASTMLTDQCQFILTGGGDRSFAQAQAHDVALTIPASKFAVIVEGLEGTQRADLKYPLSSPLPVQDFQFPSSFCELMDYLKQDA